jgi:hypothetical protein
MANRRLLILLGILLMLAGAIPSKKSPWAVLGVLLILAGATLYAVGRMKPKPPA